MGVYVGLGSHDQEQVQALQSHLPVPSVTMSLSSPGLTPSLCLSLQPLNARLWK